MNNIGPVLNRFLAIPLALLSVCFQSCETTDISYGYVADALDEVSIMELIELSDQSINNREFKFYEGLFAPRFYILDKSEPYGMSQSSQLSRSEYMDLVEEILRSAREINVYTMVTAIQIEEPGIKAVVKVQEDVLLDFMGDHTGIWMGNWYKAAPTARSCIAELQQILHMYGEEPVMKILVPEASKFKNKKG